MSLFCNDLHDDYYDDNSWYYYVPTEIKKLETKRAKRCCSCKKLLRPGDEVGAFDRWRMSRGDIEEKIYGDGAEIWLATWYMCEDCTGLFWALYELGYGCDLGRDNMRDLVKEYNAMRKNGTESMGL
jgi:hypothetical protein